MGKKSALVEIIQLDLTPDSVPPKRRKQLPGSVRAAELTFPASKPEVSG